MQVAVSASRTSLSVRQYERRFLDEIGMMPKLFARIARYQMGMEAKLITPARSWLEIAHEFGYYDQMHMIKDFQVFGGDSLAASFAIWATATGGIAFLLAIRVSRLLNVELPYLPHHLRKEGLVQVLANFLLRTESTLPFGIKQQNFTNVVFLLGAPAPGSLQ